MHTMLHDCGISWMFCRSRILRAAPNVMVDSLRRGADQGGQAAPARLGAGAGLCQLTATL